MSTTDVTERAPRLVDPDPSGWADEPKVTRAEESLYGSYAGVMRLLGQATTAAGDTYSLVCKRSVERAEMEVRQENRDRVEREDQALVQATWDLYRSAYTIQNEIARVALTRQAKSAALMPT